MSKQLDQMSDAELASARQLLLNQNARLMAERAKAEAKSKQRQAQVAAELDAIDVEVRARRIEREPRIGDQTVEIGG